MARSWNCSVPYNKTDKNWQEIEVTFTIMQKRKGWWKEDEEILKMKKDRMRQGYKKLQWRKIRLNSVLVVIKFEVSTAVFIRMALYVVTPCGYQTVGASWLWKQDVSPKLVFTNKTT
jgi:hypothetical protein